MRSIINLIAASLVLIACVSLSAQAAEAKSPVKSHVKAHVAHKHMTHHHMAAKAIK